MYSPTSLYKSEAVDLRDCTSVSYITCYSYMGTFGLPDINLKTSSLRPLGFVTISLIFNMNN